jgi:penicillin-insensitive murein endopeptidase
VRIASLASVALSTAVALSTGVVPGAAPKHRTVARAGSLGPAALRFGRSIGSPTEGHLLGGAHLTETSYLRVVPAYGSADVRWGLEPLVQMIDRAARQVRHQFPDAITSVGHLSQEGGGEIDRHRSHESGRDADIAFFVRSTSGQPLAASHFVPFRGDGTAVSWPGARFDDAKNWTLVAAMVGDAEAHVTHIFVAAPLRARLLAYAERMGAPASLRMRAAELLQQPRGALPHDDHFHVRIACPAGMSGCVENPAMHVRRGSDLASHARPGDGAGTSPGRTRRLGRSPALVTSPPARTPEAPAPAPADEPRPEEPSRQPDAPPASMPAPVDDVDG